MFFEQESLHEALVPMLQSILDSAGADNSSSLTAIITQFLKSQGKRRPISRKRQASLDLDSLKSHGKISPQTFIQGWSLVTLRNSVQLQGWSLVTLRNSGQLQGWSQKQCTAYRVGLLWPSKAMYSWLPELLQQLCITTECNRCTCRPHTLCTHCLSAFSLSTHADTCCYSRRRGVRQQVSWAANEAVHAECLSMCLSCYRKFIPVSLTLQL